MVNFYLDGTLVNDVDAEISFSIIREDGFGNTEQILREKSETELDFFGDAYKYLCEARQSYCATIDIVIDIKNGNAYESLFEGILFHADIEMMIPKKIGKIDSIKDTSFSALIVLFWENEIPLYSTKTLNCEDLIFEQSDAMFSLDIILPYTNGYSLNVLDVIKFFVSYISDNKISVVSDYLTNNKIHVSTGYALHNTTGTLDKLYPKLSLKKLLNELRKATTIYTIVDKDLNGNVTFRIEDENYSYGSDVVLNIDDIPLDFVENLNNNNIYNQIKTGNATERTEDITIWQGNRLSGWTSEAFVGCGCYGLKDSVLDLITDFITDGAILQSTKETPAGEDSGYDTNVFMYAVTPHNFIPSPVQLVDFQKESGIKNTFMWNERILERWVGIANSCIALQRNAKYGFEVNSTFDFTISSGQIPINQPFTSDQFNLILYSNPLSPNYDNLNSLNNDINGVDNFTYFLCQENGDYEFSASCLFSKDTNITGQTDVIGATLYLSIEAWSGVGGTQIGYQEFVINNAPNLTTNPQALNLNAQFSLAVGNIVFVRPRMVYNNVGFAKWSIKASNCKFILISDNFSCNNLEDNLGNFKPFEAEFEYPLCFNDYKALRANKRGIIRINGKDTWIRQVKYKPNDLSIIKVKYKESMCSC